MKHARWCGLVLRHARDIRKVARALEGNHRLTGRALNTLLKAKARKKAL